MAYFLETEGWGQGSANLSPMSATYALFEKDRELGVSDGTPIRYTVRGSGDGPTVVLANGWSCSDAYWVYLVPHLEERGHRLIVADTRGHGESGLPRSPGFKGRNIKAEDMSVERMALDLLEVARHEGADQTVFVGHSMGVQTILEAYRQAPDMVTGLVAIAGPYENPLKSFYGRGFWDHLFPLGRVAVTAIPGALTAAWWRVGNNAALGLKAAQAIGAAGPKVTTELLAPYITHLSTRDPVILFKAIDGMRRHSAAGLLPEVQVPVLNLVGGKDTFSPPSLQEHMHEVLPYSELVRFDDATHCLPIEEPEGVNDAVDRFVTRVAQPRRSTSSSARAASDSGAASS